MNSKIYKISLAILTIIGFVIVSFHIHRLLSVFNKDSPTVLVAINPLLLISSLLIMSAWIFFGIIGGLLFLILSSLLVILVANTTGILYYNLHILLFVTVGIISHIFINKTKLFCRLNDVKIEKLLEDKNLLTAQLERNIDLTEALEKKIYRYAQLGKVVEELATNLSLFDINNIIVEKSIDTIGKSDTSVLFLVDEEKQELALVASKVKDINIKIKAKKGDVFDNWVFRQRLPLIVEDAKRDFRFDYKQKSEEKRQFNSLISAPLITHKRIMGILRLDSPQVNNYTPDDLRLLDIIADIAAVIIYNAKLYQKTQELAITDTLTGLYVHRYFHQRFSEELLRASTSNYPLALLMLDIDHFKDYNDKYGHAAGDRILEEIAKAIKKFTHEGDMVARYGGEEFAVVLPHKDRQKAVEVAESIRGFISNKEFLLRRQPTKITVSVGIASFPQDAKLKEDLLEKTDFCLYKAKKQGRNKVCHIES